jgi:DUF438 domain-containing protein
MIADLAGLADQTQFGQLTQQLCVNSCTFTNQHDRVLFTQPGHERFPVRRVGVGRDFVPCEQTEAIKLSHRVLIIVKYGYLHVTGLIG